MNAVLRLNLLVSIVFVVALVVTLQDMLRQATKDITREVTAGVSFTHQMLSVAIKDEALLNKLLAGDTRHVHLEIVDAVHLDGDRSSDADEDIPQWFVQMIPDLDTLLEKKYYRFLPDGRALKLQADPSDELEEVWESVQDVLILFCLSALLSNIAIYMGVKQGIKPVADILGVLNDIAKGRYNARLEGYAIHEINELSQHINTMASSLEQAESDNKRLTHELMRLQEKERAHLARELHDDLGQYLTGIRAQAYLIKNSAHVPDLVSSVGEQIATNCDAMQVSFRQLIRELHPVILEQLGLLEAVRAQVDTWQQVHNIPVILNLPDFLPTSSDESYTHIYRIVQESLNNIAQHAEANEVEISLAVDEQYLMLRITDDGKGACDDKDKNDRGSGLGLCSMQERARCMQGELIFHQVEDKGSEVLLRAPIYDSLSGIQSAY